MNRRARWGDGFHALTLSPISDTRRKMSEAKPYTVTQPDELSWRPSNLMKVPNADILADTGSNAIGAKLWRFPPMSASTLHRHVTSEEFYFVLEGVGRIRVGDKTLTIQKHGSIHIMPDQMRQVFNDTEQDVLWLMIGAPDDEVIPSEGGNPKDFYPEDPTQLPVELEGCGWPP